MPKKRQIKDTFMEDKYLKARKRGYYRTMDLFSGCGGMTLGFDRAGFRCVGAVEIDKDAGHSHEMNFKDIAPNGQYELYKDITNTNPKEAVAHLDANSHEDIIDVIVGGPPCQAFSLLGRAALWDLSGKKNSHHDDPRSVMYEYFLEYVRALRPLAFVMENVREMGRFARQNLAHRIAATAEEMGYNTRYTILNSVWYGVPQLRERIFIIGIAKELNKNPKFPVIKHDYALPVGYSTSRAGTGRIDILPPYDFYEDYFERSEITYPAVTAEMAFADLPAITHHLDGRVGKGRPRDVKAQVEYATGVTNPFIHEMRNWPGFESEDKLSGHVIRYTPRDYEIFRRMPHGGMYPEALETAEQIFAERLSLIERETDQKIEEGDPLWADLRARTVPPYKANRYPNKFRKMWPDQPARTVPAHIGKDSYSHIHFDGNQARTLSLREAARLQSFPDGFKIYGSMNSQLRQIGNAVPPLLAYAVAATLWATLGEHNVNHNQEKADQLIQLG